MKFVRFEAHGEVAFGVVDDGVVNQITGAPYDEFEVLDHSHPLSAVKLLAPVVPNKIVAIGLNYRSHLGDREPPKVPEPFFKTTSSVIGPGDTIVIPRDAINEGVLMQPEAELTVVIGRRCKGATRANALTYVLGYTCGNDVSARDWQGNDLSWWRGKSSDTFCPLGPFIVTDLDPADLHLMGRVNGKTVQDSSTSDMVHDVPTIIEYISRVVTLEPGDVIMTGTPGQPGDIHPGDAVEIEIEGIGVLRNPVAAE